MDIDAREALVQALNNYEGAIVIVSHDPNMVERVAERLWLVKDGIVQDFDGDLEDYRKFTIQSRRDERKDEKIKKSQAEKIVPTVEATPIKINKSGGNQAKLREIEKSMNSLNKERERLEKIMADPSFYTDSLKISEVQKLYAQRLKDIEAIEELWLQLQVVA